MKSYQNTLIHIIVDWLILALLAELDGDNYQCDTYCRIAIRNTDLFPKFAK